MVVSVVHALLMIGSWQAVQGLGVWLGQVVGFIPPWILAAEEQAKSRSAVNVWVWEGGQSEYDRYFCCLVSSVLTLLNLFHDPLLYTCTLTLHVHACT